MQRSVRVLVTTPLIVAGLVLAGSTAAMAGAGSPLGGHPQDTARTGAPAGPQQRLALGAARAATNDNATLFGNSCTSASNCVAVGFYQIPSEDIVPALVENYTGTSWQADVPIPQYSAYATIAEQVSCGATGTCMLVGDHFNNSAKPSMLAEISSGSTWSILRWNDPRGVRWGVLDAVSCVGSSYCMAVGTADKALEQNYSAEWNGSGTLKQISTPDPARARWADIAGVSCRSATDCMAVGDYENSAKRVLTFAEAWNGTKWRLVPGTPNVKGQKESLFNDISCATPARCVAIGFTLSSGSRSVEHAFAATWTSGKWRQSAPVNAAGAALFGVSCPAARYCIAVGADGESALAERWNGSSWRVFKVARTGAPRRADSLEHVSCISTRHCVAVGFRYNPARSYTDHTLAEVWNGSAWKLQNTPNP
jgi:hypothetical protein